MKLWQGASSCENRPGPEGHTFRGRPGRDERRYAHAGRCPSLFGGLVVAGMRHMTTEQRWMRPTVRHLPYQEASGG